MSKELAQTEKIEQLSPTVVENVLLRGDLSKLDNAQRLSYYKNLCYSLSLNPLTKPFEYMTLNGKMVLYATKACAEQLRMRDGVSIEEVKTQIDENYVRVTAKAKNKEGRTDVAMAVVCITGLKGDARANAEMKADTKAKRRVTLSLCGLGMLDETEVDSIPDAKKVVTAEDVYEGVAEPEIYTVPFGKHKDKTIEEICVNAQTGEFDTKPLTGYITWIRESAERQKKPIEGVVGEFIERAQSFLEEKEMQREFENITK